MAVRSTMSDLIIRVRSLIGDPAGVNQQFDDQTVQDALDASRQDVRYLDLLPAQTYNGSQVLYLDYYTNQGLGDWESDGTLWQYRYNAVVPSTSDWITGHWTFATTTLPPVFIIGKTYDIYRASASLLRRWAAITARQFSFSSDGQSFQRHQISHQLMQLALDYDKRGRIRSMVMHRDDIASAKGDGGSVDIGPNDVDFIATGDNGR